MRVPWRTLTAVALSLAACASPAPEPGPQPASPDASASASPTAPASPAERPDHLVAVTTGHQLVVVDADTGETVSVLHVGDDPDDFGDEGEEPFAAGAFLDSVAIDQARGVVWFPTCCEPAPGALRTVPVAGGQPRTVGVGYDPALHPTDDRVAVVEMQWISILDFDGRAAHRFDAAAKPPMEIARPSWSPDGRTIAFEAMVDNRGEPEIHLLPADARSMDDARRVPADAAKAPWRNPVFDASGALWLLEQSAGPDAQSTSRLRIDPASGEVLERLELPVHVTRQNYDRSGAHLLMVLASGELLWESGGNSKRLPGSFVSAAW